MIRGRISKQTARVVWVDYASMFYEQEKSYFDQSFAGEGILAYWLGITRQTARIPNRAFIDRVWGLSKDHNLVLIIVPRELEFKNDAPAFFGRSLEFASFHDVVAALQAESRVQCLYTTNTLLAGHDKVELFGIGH